VYPEGRVRTFFLTTKVTEVELRAQRFFDFKGSCWVFNHGVYTEGTVRTFFLTAEGTEVAPRT